MNCYFIIFIILFSQIVNAQSQKGNIELNLDGTVFSRTGYNDSEHKPVIKQVSPLVGIGYFVKDNISIDASIALLNITIKPDGDDDLEMVKQGSAVQLGLGGSYHYPINKFTPFAGLRMTSQFGALTKVKNTNPFFIGALAGVKYWPKETGAIYSALSYDVDIATKQKSKEFGINVGLIIRLK